MSLTDREARQIPRSTDQSAYQALLGLLGVSEDDAARCARNLKPSGLPTETIMLLLAYFTDLVPEGTDNSFLELKDQVTAEQLDRLGTTGLVIFYVVSDTLHQLNGLMGLPAPKLHLSDFVHPAKKPQYYSLYGAYEISFRTTGSNLIGDALSGAVDDVLFGCPLEDVLVNRMTKPLCLFSERVKQMGELDFNISVVCPMRRLIDKKYFCRKTTQ